MKNTTLFGIWGGMYALCAGLGFIPAPAGAGKAALVILAVLFFLPPAALIARASQQKDTRTLLLIRNLSALWLGLTTALLVGNFLSLAAAAWVGDLLHYLLVIVSSPMVCGQYWVMGLFLWACLLFASLRELKHIKKDTRK